MEPGGRAGGVESNASAVGRTRLGWGTVRASTGAVVEGQMMGGAKREGQAWVDQADLVIAQFTLTVIL